MLDYISTVLRRECKIYPDDHLLVGVSGGPDSLSLLHILYKLGYPIIAVHVNHRLRPEADEEAQFVGRFAANLRVEFVSCQVDVVSYSHGHSISIEEAARTLRYQSLFERAKALGANAVVVGHNADDQVETILMHLLRGSGLSGLKGMEFRTVPNPWSEDIPLLRPFLSTWRADILKYVDEHKFTPVSDSSNLDTSFFRNRLRHELVPTLESYNPGFRQVLLRMGQILRDDYSVLQLSADQAWEAILIEQGRGYLAFRTAVFLDLSRSIQRYLLRMAIAYHLPGLRDVSFDCIDRGLTLLAGEKPSSQMDLIAGLRLIKEREQFWVATWQADLPGSNFPAITQGEKRLITVPSIVRLNNDWQLQVEEISEPESAILHSDSNSDPFQAWLDISQLDQPLFVRVREPGDQIMPLGMNGHSVKISDLMINLKLPKRARSTWPLVCGGKEILWVPGYRQSYLACINSNTTKALHLTLSRIPSS